MSKGSSCIIQLSYCSFIACAIHHHLMSSSDPSHGCVWKHGWPKSDGLAHDLPIHMATGCSIPSIHEVYLSAILNVFFDWLLCAQSLVPTATFWLKWFQMDWGFHSHGGTPIADGLYNQMIWIPPWYPHDLGNLHSSDVHPKILRDGETGWKPLTRYLFVVWHIPSIPSLKWSWIWLISLT